MLSTKQGQASSLILSLAASPTCMFANAFTWSVTKVCKVCIRSEDKLDIHRFAIESSKTLVARVHRPSPRHNCSRNDSRKASRAGLGLNRHKNLHTVSRRSDTAHNNSSGGQNNFPNCWRYRCHRPFQCKLKSLCNKIHIGKWPIELA